MRYTYFEVENFKGIHQLRLDLDRPPKGSIQTLVGLNESGKTTVLEAIDYFTKGNEELGPKTLAGRLRPNEHDLIPIAERANFNGQIKVRAGVEITDEDKLALAKFLRLENKYRLEHIASEISVEDVYSFSNSAFKSHQALWNLNASGRIANTRKIRPLFRRENREVWLAATKFLSDRMPPIWYFPNFLFDFPPRIYLNDTPEDTSRDRFYRALLQDILSAVDASASVEEHIVLRAESGKEPDNRALHQLLLEMSRKVTEDIFTAWNRIFRRNVENKRIILRIANDESRGRYIEFQIEDDDGYFFLHERSLGFRWFFVFLLLTTYRGFRRDSFPGLVFLFDEPASNLHASAQAQLLGSLERLGEDSTIIYTTHSHHLINPNWLENTYVVRNKGIEVGEDVTEYHARKTDIVIERYRTFASQHPDQSHYFQPILDMLDYSPSQLELVPDMVMAEGKNDFYAFQYMHDVILGLDLGLHFLPGGGAGSLDQLIRLYIGWARKFVVILDSDGEGIKQKQRYIEMFGAIVENKVFTLGDLISGLSGKGLERAFEKTDRDAIQSVVYSGQAYRKKKFYRSLQEALATKTKVAITEPASDRFSQLLHGLKTALECQE